MSEQRRLPIEPSYCENWTITDALREIIQNAVDTGTKVNFDMSDDGNFCTISDSGAGIKLADFLIGRTSKRHDKETIGQFGEGAPVGCLVLARSGRKVSFSALGKVYKFTIQFDPAWDASLLTIDIEESPIHIGTAVTVECSDDEIEKAKNLFLAFSPKEVLDKVESGSILRDAGKVYVHGLMVSTADSVFGYNFNNKSLVNRDRNVVGHWELINEISKILADVSDREVITTLLEEGEGNETNHTEFSACFTINHPIIWKRAVKELWGDKVALTSGITYVDNAAVKKNWTILHFSYSFTSALKSIIPNATEAASQKISDLIVDLEPADAEFLAKAKGIADEIAVETGLKPYPVKVFRLLEEGGLFRQLGEAHATYCTVNYTTVAERNLNGLVRTIIHEYTHHTTGFLDHTLEFDNAAFDVAVTIGIKFVQLRKDHRDNLLNQKTIRDMKILAEVAERQAAAKKV